MFVQYYTYVPVGLGVAQTRIESMRASLEGWGDVVYRDGEDLRARVGPKVHGRAKEVRLTIGEGEARRVGVVYPVAWIAVGAETLFPRLTASLTLTELGPDRTKVSIEGTYEPPGGAVGRFVDRIALKNVAEATVKDWIDRVAEAVSATPELR